jgi:hypothetical protein
MRHLIQHHFSTRTLLVLLCMSLLLIGTSGAFAQTATAPAGWSGTGGAGPYEIATLNNLYWLSQTTDAWDDDFLLIAHINASDTGGWDVVDLSANGTDDDGDGEIDEADEAAFAKGFSPIGNVTTSFTGSFDGQGYAITGLTIDRPEQNFVGLFGLAFGATIRNVGLEGGAVRGTWSNVGGLVGINNGGTVTSCYGTGAVTGVNQTGGLVGQNLNGGSITSCYATGTVTGGDYVGGLVGYNWNSTITSCYATGAVTGDTEVGGLVGKSSDISMISSCYATGAVTGTGNNVGGLVGMNATSDTITSCYATGLVTGGTSVGGFTGENTGTITSCYWDTETSAETTGIGTGTGDVTGLTSANMLLETSFTDFTFDVPDWFIVEGASAPQLYWEVIGSTSTYAGGDGTVDNPWQIENLGQLYHLSATTADWGGHFVVTAEIDASDTANWNVGDHDGDDGTTNSPHEAMGFSPVGGNAIRFTGSMDGQGHVISNLFINRPVQDYVGLFGTIDSGASIRELGLEDASITGHDFVGSLIGINEQADIEFCYATGVVSGNYQVGGLLGYHNGGNVTNCYATADATGDDYVGGLVGYNEAPLSSCHATGTVTGGSDAGGLIGYLSSGDLTACHATGAVTGSGDTGGLVGYLSSGSLTSCNATGTVAGTDHVGGLVGTNLSGNPITACFATGAVTGTAQGVGGLVGDNSGAVTSCYATGAVSGDTYFGGFIGANYSTVTACYATGAVTGNAYFGAFIGQNYDDVTSCYATGLVTIMGGGGSVGGFVGDNEAGTIASCYWDADTTGQTISSGGGTGLTTSEMLAQANFTGFDFVTNPDWAIVDGETRPYLPWQTAAVLEGAATPEALWFTLDAGYVFNASAAGSGITLDDYGIAYREEGTDEIMYHAASGAAIEPEMSVALDGEVVEGLKEDTFYFYRAYATDSNGHTHYGTEHEVFTKAASTVTTWPTADAITYGQTLADAALSGGASTPSGSFAFDAPATAPGVADSGTAYAVTFTPDDGDYGIVFGSVPVTVNKATPTVTSWPTAADITYGGTLADAGFTGGDASVDGAFAFDAPGTAPNAGTASFAATFTPTDAVDYATVSGSVSVTTAQATPTVTWPSASAITYGDSLTNAMLVGGASTPTGAFAFDALVSPNAGTANHAVTFTPNDTANYATLSDSVSVTVVKAAPAVSAWPTATSITEGQSLAACTLSGGEASVAGAFAFDAPTTTPSVGTYFAEVTFTPTDTANYTLVSGTIEVSITANPEGEGEGEAPAEGEGEAPTEGEGEAPAEGEGETPAEGEGETPAEGEGEAPAEGEGETPAEGEGEAPAEGEGEAPAEGEGEAPSEGEGEALAEGEGETPAEGEGETPAEGEAAEGEATEGEANEGETTTEGEGETPAEGEITTEGEDAATEPCATPDEGEGVRKQFGDWLWLGAGLAMLMASRKSMASRRTR